MAEIYIARHGITESNKRKIYMGTSMEGLAPEGIKQTKTLGKSLQSLGIQCIYSSPLQRAMETSKVINRFLNVAIIPEKGLAEMKLGCWAGLTEEEVSKKFPDDYQLWNTRPGDLILNGREILFKVQNRILKTILKIRENNSKFPVLVVTHVALIRCLIIYYQSLDVTLYRTIDIPNASVFILQIDDNLVRISRYL